MTTKKINIKKAVYSLATLDGNSAELTMYGDIFEKRPVDWRTGEATEDDCITLDEFLSDLEQIRGASKLEIRMNSYGGDANAANVIHNRLRELSRGGMEITCIVDGVAMSGGSLIMCAADRVEVNPSSLIMIHNAWTFVFGGYNAQELRELAEQMDAWDEMQASIYERKTGLAHEDILGMMSETTYMTGAEALEKGFADALIEDAAPLQIAASADRRTLYIAGRKLRLTPGVTAPETLHTTEDPDVWGERMLNNLRKGPEKDGT